MIFSAVFAVLALLQGSTSPLIDSLQSSDPSFRMAAYWALVGAPEQHDSPQVAERLKSPQIQRALVHTLELENLAAERSFRQGSGAANDYGEVYAEYTAWLADTVASFVDADDAQGLRAIARAPFLPESSFAKKLASYGEPVVAPLLELSKSDLDAYRAAAYDVLGQVVGLQKKGLVRRGVSKQSTRQVSLTLRDGLNDSNPSVRRSAVRGLAHSGDVDALPVLEQLRTSDAYQFNGHFPVREEAEKAIAGLRRDP